MKSYYVNKLIPKLFLLLLIGGVAFSSGGCKSKKKLAQEAAAKEYAEKVAKAKAELQAILDDNGTMPLAEMERRLNDIKAQNLNDPEVDALIVQVEEKASLKELFIYSTDGAFDISPWLSLVYGFIPVFGVNTEPSIGYGRAVVHHYWDGL